MSFKRLVALLGAAIFLLSALSLPPFARAETNAANVKGALYTLDLGAKTITVKKSDATTVTLKFNSSTKFQRNNKNSKAKSLVLQDSIQVQVKGKLALLVKATGVASKKVAGKLNDASKGTGTVMINGKTVQTTAQTRIARNGELVSLGRLTTKDTLLAHVKKSAKESSKPAEALDLIANGPEDGEVHGTISALGADQVTITPRNGTADVTLNVTGDTMIEKDGADATFADLAVGQQVEASYDPTTNNAFSIQVDSHGESDDAHVNGTVTAVDLGANTVTIAPEVGDPVTVNVDASTKVKVNNVCGTITDIQVGMPAFAEYDTATMLASEIKAGAGDDNHEDNHLKGTVAAVDAGAQTVTITPKEGGADVVLNVTTETEIEVNGEHGSIDDIQVGDPIRAEYDASTLNAFELKVGDEHHGGGGDHEDHKVVGKITGIDLDAKSVTIDPSAGDPVMVLVVDSTEIHVNGKHATIADLAVGDQAEAEFDPDSFEAREIKVEHSMGGGDDDEHEVRGIITAIDLGLNTVTITPESGDPVTVNVIESTEIRLNGEHAGIGDLTVGDQAKAEYDPDSMQAREIKAMH